MSAVVGNCQMCLIYCRRHLTAAIQLAVSCSELYFTRFCALKRTGTIALENKVKLKLMCIFKLMTFDA